MTQQTHNLIALLVATSWYFVLLYLGTVALVVTSSYLPGGISLDVRVLVLLLVCLSLVPVALRG